MKNLHVNVVDALVVDPETMSGLILRYPRLKDRIATLAPLIMQAKRQVQLGAVDAFTIHRLKREITSYDLLCTAEALQEASTTAEERLLAVQFTKLSKQLFGEPDPAVVSRLAAEALVEFRSWRGRVNEVELRQVEAAYEQLIHDHDKAEPITIEAVAIASAIKDELQARYHTVFSLIDNGPALCTASHTADIFEQALHLLAADDPAWSEWTVNRKADTAICSVSPVRKQVSVGLRRQAMTRDECRGVLAHEILVHAARGVNGAKCNDLLLATGLPGYVAAEEGLAVLLEFVMSGTMPQKMSDRYLDTALALKGTNRQQLFTIALARARLRAEVFRTHLQQDELQPIIWAQTNRMYRGTKGDEVVGVFTKDICYYNGFSMIVTYVVRALADGHSLPEVLTFLLSAKFDPTNRQHLDYLVGRELPITP